MSDVAVDIVGAINAAYLRLLRARALWHPDQTKEPRWVMHPRTFEEYLRAVSWGEVLRTYVTPPDKRPEFRSIPIVFDRHLPFGEVQIAFLA